MTAVLHVEAALASPAPSLIDEPVASKGLVLGERDVLMARGFDAR
jgi:hypothetical protein